MTKLRSVCLYTIDTHTQTYNTMTIQPTKATTKLTFNKKKEENEMANNPKTVLKIGGDRRMK